MNEKTKFTVVALGGSIIVSRKIQTAYLKRLRNFLKTRIEKGDKFVLVAGGGSVARNYQKAALSVRDVSDEDKDWLGIHSSRLNAHLMRTIFRDIAYIYMIKHYDVIDKKAREYPVVIGGGWIQR